MKRKNSSAEGRKRHRGNRGGPSIDDTKSLRGYAMILATCDAGREGAASTELQRLISQDLENRSAHVDSGAAIPALVSGDPASVRDRLQEEIDAIKSHDDNKEAGAVAIRNVQTNCRGLILLRIGPRVQAQTGVLQLDETDNHNNKNTCEPPNLVRLVKDLFEDVATTKEACSRHLVRVLPLQMTCFAGVDEIMTASEALLTEHFGPSSPACSYMVAVKRRNNPTFDKDGLIRQLALAVNERHTVDLTAPQRVILIEVFQSLCGVSVVHKYPEFYSYNLRRFQEKLVLKEESSPGEAKAEETELTKESSGEAKVEETSPSDVVDGN